MRLLTYLLAGYAGMLVVCSGQEIPKPQVADTKFSMDRGFYDEPFYVKITSATEGASIRYTINGSTPGSVFTGRSYPGGDGILISTTTTLRAQASKLGYEPSDIDTHTYIFPHEVSNQPDKPPGFSTAWVGSDYGMEQDPAQLARIAGDRSLDATQAKEVIAHSLRALPAVSLVMAHEDIFGARKGIYHHPLERGRDWERPVSVEWVDPEGAQGFQVDAGIRLQGFTSRFPERNPKHSLRLVFRKAYGPGKWRFPLFGPDAAGEFDTLILRSNAQDAWVYDSAGNRAGQFVRDEWTRRTHLALGQPAPHGTWVHLFINGLYWGVYNPTERPDAAFMEAYVGGSKDDYDILKNHEEVLDGQGDAYHDLLTLIQNDPNRFSRGYRSFESLAAYQAIQGLDPLGKPDPELPNYVDVASLIDYLIPNMYAAAVDWPGNNYIGRSRLEDSGGFKFFSWDNEHGLKGNVSENRVVPHWRDEDSPTKVHHALKSNAEYRVRFGDHLHRAFFNSGPLYVDPRRSEWDPEHPGRNRPAALWMSLTGGLEEALIAESARWGDYRRAQTYTVADDFKSLRAQLLENWFPQRSQIVLKQFRDEGLYPALEAVTFSQNGGVLEPDGSLSLSSKSVNPFLAGATIYYTLNGEDPRALGGAVHADAKAYSRPLRLEKTSWLLARVAHEGEWSALNEALFLVNEIPLSEHAGLALTGIHYHPVEPNDAEIAAGFKEGSAFEYLELTNIHASDAINLSGLKVRGGVWFDLEEQALVSLNPNERVYIANEPEAFRERYGDAYRLTGTYRGQLSNGGETITVLDGRGQLLQQVAYDDEPPWPLEADGMGPALTFSGEWRRTTDDQGRPETRVDPFIAYFGVPGHRLAAETTIRLEGGRLVMQFTRLTEPGVEASLGFEFSKGLDSWSALDAVQLETSADTPGRERVEAAFNAVSAEGFVRLKLQFR